jgi:hypothetical protein
LDVAVGRCMIAKAARGDWLLSWEEMNEWYVYVRTLCVCVCVYIYIEVKRAKETTALQPPKELKQRAHTPQQHQQKRFRKMGRYMISLRVFFFSVLFLIGLNSRPAVSAVCLFLCCLSAHLSLFRGQESGPLLHTHTHSSLRCFHLSPSILLYTPNHARSARPRRPHTHPSNTDPSSFLARPSLCTTFALSSPSGSPPLLNCLP